MIKKRLPKPNLNATKLVIISTAHLPNTYENTINLI
jgi:hypothetical protein